MWLIELLASTGYEEFNKDTWFMLDVNTHTNSLCKTISTKIVNPIFYHADVYLQIFFFDYINYVKILLTWTGVRMNAHSIFKYDSITAITTTHTI